MMKNQKTLLLLMLSIWSILGYSNGATTEETVPQIIEVSVKTNPETLIVNEEITIVAQITQGEDTVYDADEVKFEIWKEGQPEDQHEEVEAKWNKSDGIYYVEKIFEEQGIYNVIAHVTARGMHSMPTVPIEVGEK